MQTIGRAARNVNAKVILYADKMTDSMQRAIDETDRRRELQQAYNAEHGITPETIKKAIHRGIESEASAHAQANAAVGRTDETQYITEEYLAELEAEMLAAAKSWSSNGPPRSATASSGCANNHRRDRSTRCKEPPGGKRRPRRPRPVPRRPSATRKRHEFDRCPQERTRQPRRR